MKTSDCEFCKHAKCKRSIAKFEKVHLYFSISREAYRTRKISDSDILIFENRPRLSFGRGTQVNSDEIQSS